jgi:hypothetical protein
MSRFLTAADGEVLLKNLLAEKKIYSIMRMENGDLSIRLKKDTMQKAQVPMQSKKEVHVCQDGVKRTRGNVKKHCPDGMKPSKVKVQILE